MDKAILLRKQVRENWDDMQRESTDLKLWEEQMNKKDLEIRNMKDDKVLPPVRTKKKKTDANVMVSKTENPSKIKRIAGSDYNAWNKFDADEACKNIDKNDLKNEEKIYEIASEAELQKEHQEATKIKEEGNILVKKQEYAAAVGKYSQAIKVFPYDATFYANRAHCQLQLNNLYSADADCTEAIKLNEKYVKAYQRRAKIRIELKKYEEALKDYEVILKLEPNHKDVKTSVVQLRKKIELTSKQTMIISGNEINQTSIEKQIGDKLKMKLTASSQSGNKPNQNQNNKKEKSNVIENNEHCDSIQIGHKQTRREIVESEYNAEQAKRLKKIEEKLKKKDELPPWLPKLKPGVSIVKPVTSEHLMNNRRQKQKLKRVVIEEITENESIFKDITEEQIKGPIEEQSSPIKCKNNKISSELKFNEIRKKEDPKETMNLPAPPKSSVGFLLNWKKNISSEFRYEYLKLIKPEDIPDIFKDSMESHIFSEILSILNSRFVTNGDKVYDYLLHLSKLKRFRALVLFMTQEDKKTLKNLFEICKYKENKSKEVDSLYAAYEM